MSQSITYTLREFFSANPVDVADTKTLKEATQFPKDLIELIEASPSVTKRRPLTNLIRVATKIIDRECLVGRTDVASEYHDVIVELARSFVKARGSFGSETAIANLIDNRLPKEPLFSILTFKPRSSQEMKPETLELLKETREKLKFSDTF